MSDKEELEHLRKLAQENSERNATIDGNDAMAALVGITWTLTFILTIVIFLKTSWDENAWLNFIIPTVASILMARWYRSGERILRAQQKENLGWEEPEVS